MTGPRRAPAAPAPEVRRAQLASWVAMTVIAVGVAGGFLLDQDANPVAQGLLATVAALEAMIAVLWWRSTRRREGR